MPPKMSEFEDYEGDMPDGACEVCGDPMCPGCGPSIQTRLLKVALVPLGIIVIAFGIRSILFGEDGDTAPQETSSPTAPLETTPVENDSTIAQRPISAPRPISISEGSLTEDAIRSVVQVVISDSYGPCAYGSGTVVIDSLTVLTNYHVVDENSNCLGARVEIWTVSALDERPQATYSAEVVKTDDVADLAVLRLTPLGASGPSLRPIPIKTATSVGEEIFVIGFPGIGGSSITVSKGVVSGYTKESGVSWIKTDASISGGNSGGAALNNKGELIGVPTRASVSEDGEVVDCRVVADTNRDGVIDDYDNCSPIGGFLNLLSPAGRADLLLNQ
ncbi:MAG: hypothetical protein RL069_1266 [Planctomycetota bacterium]